MTNVVNPPPAGRTHYEVWAEEVGRLCQPARGMGHPCYFERLTYDLYREGVRPDQAARMVDLYDPPPTGEDDPW